MIFVSVGTNEARFDRLLRAVAELDTDEERVVQRGHSAAISAPGTTVVEFLGFEEMAAAIRRARVFVTHAGVGSVLVALASGKRPVVVPRRKLFAEAVDDHQLQLGRRFGAAGLVTLVEDVGDLGAAVASAMHDAALTPDAGTLATDLHDYLAAAVGQAAGPARRDW